MTKIELLNRKTDISFKLSKNFQKSFNNLLNFAERLFGATFGRVPTIGDCVSVMAETVEGFEITISSLKY